MSTSSEQRQEMVEFLKKHPELSSGKFSNDFSPKKARELWELLASQLNTLPGAKKDWKKWRKTWHDIKTRTKKKKKSEINQHRIRTGGGPPVSIHITDNDEKILDIMGPVVVEGHPTVLESQAIFETCNRPPFQEVALNDVDDSLDMEIQIPSIADPSGMLPGASISKSNENRFEEKSVKKQTHPKRLQRLDKTISATQKLAEQTERDIVMRKEYLNKKLELYEKDIVVKERIATALELIAESIS